MPAILTRIKAALAILAGYHMQEWSPDRQWRVQRSRLARDDIPHGVRRLLLDWSREMERRDPLFNRFLDLCEQYVVGPTGLRIMSGSSDARYATAANEFWDDWQPLCDVASRFSFGQRQGLIERELEVAGEVFVFLTFGSTGFPRIQLIESEKVETPPKLSREKDIVDGVRILPNGRPVGYFVNTSGEDYEEVDADRMVHMWDPSRIGQPRALPIVYAVLEGLVDRAELQRFELASAKDHSRLSRVIKTATGAISPAELVRSAMRQSSQNSAGTATTQTAQEYYEQVTGGAKVDVLRNGDSMELLQSNRPSIAVQSFYDALDGRNAAGLGLPIEIIIMRSLQGTMARGAFDMANGFFRCRSAARAEQFGRIFNWVTGSSTELRRIQPRDWRKTKYTPPKAINVDVGRNSNALIAEWQQGWWTLDDIVGPYGKTGAEVLEQRALDFKLAREIEQKHGLNPGDIFPISTTEAPEPAEEFNV